MMTKKNNIRPKRSTRPQYLTNGAIYDKILLWQSSGVISPTLGKMMMDIAEGVLGKESYRRYPPEDRQDMQMMAVEKMIKNLKNIREEKKNSVFNYLTLICECAYRTYLKKFYKHINLINDLKERKI